MNDRNHWMTFANDLFVRWGAFLPAPRGDISGLLRFGAAVADAGARCAVYRLERMPALRSYRVDEKLFVQYLEGEASSRGRVPLFPRDAAPGDEFWSPARVAFYRGDSVVEEEVGNAGALLRELRPDRVATCNMFMRSAAPVMVIGESVPVDGTREVRIQIRLDTDLWFPQVLGMLEDAPEEGEPPRMYDNGELAKRHTPRLNAFLGELRQLVHELGGRWEPLEADGIAGHYGHMWNEAGILL